MYIMSIFIYLFLCYIIASIGKNRKFGFYAYLFLSIILTPIMGLLLVIASDKKKDKDD